MLPALAAAVRTLPAAVLMAEASRVATLDGVSPWHQEMGDV
jgi:hypothetical protein